MHYLIYFSTASDDVTQKDIEEILEGSRQRNDESGITGLLIYHDGSFIQMLEGPEEAVVETYGRIEKDQRHTRITKVFSGESDQRYFPDWKMSYEVIDDETARKIEGFEPMSSSVEFVAANESQHMAIKMLHYFIELKSNAR